MSPEQLKVSLEAVLLAADRPLSLRQLGEVFDAELPRPEREEIKRALQALGEDWQGRGAALVRVASGYRFQVPQRFEPWVARLWEEKPPRYSRALLETLALVAYRQPITRAEIEDVRGVSVSTQIVKTLLERDWIQVLGHKDTPGKPAMFGTTRQFLDYFGLASLEQLPSLAEIRDLEAIHPELALEEPLPVVAAAVPPAHQGEDAALPAVEGSGAPAPDAVAPARSEAEPAQADPPRRDDA